jgi:predicted PurR-regulated permease PerM
MNKINNNDKNNVIKENDLNIGDVNVMVNIGKKILNLLYIAMLIGIVFLVTLLAKEWGILKFFLTVIKVATPFFIGFVIAWIFNPIVTKLQKHGFNRGVASSLVYIIFLAILFIFFWILIPTIYNQLQDLITSLPNIVDSLKVWIGDALSNVDNSVMDATTVQNNIFNAMEDFMSTTTTNLPTLILNSVGTIFSGIGTFAISLVIGIYMLIDFNSISGHFMHYIPKKHKEEIGNLIEEIGTELRKCVNGTLFVAFMVFVGDSIGFAIVGLKAPLLFGLLCGVTDLIPYIGPYIGGIAAVIVGFSQSPIIGIITILIVCLVQCLENYVLQPVVMSKTMKLHPVTIIIGLLLFGHFFGIVGMILATPSIALMKVIYRFIAKKYNWFNKIDF